MHIEQDFDFSCHSHAEIDPHRFLTNYYGYTTEEVEYACEAIDFILNALPVVRVDERDNKIFVGGFWAKDLNADVLKEWGTQRVNNSIFIDLSARRIVIHSFFAIEVLYILETLKKRNNRTGNSKLDDLSKAIYEHSWVKRAAERPTLDMNWSRIDKEMNVTLLDSQKQFIRSYAEYVPRLNLRGMVLAAPPGTGKTIAGYSFSLAVEADITIICVPKNSVEKVWEDTIRTRFRKPQKYWISTRKDKPTGKEKYIICHYESLQKVLDIAPKISHKNVVVWLDESHNFNEETSARTNRFVEICRQSDADHVVWASGTPLKAIGKEAVPLLRTIDPLFTEDVRKPFVGIFGSTKARALDILHNRLTKVMFKIDKKSVVDNEKEEYTSFIKTPNGDDFTLHEVREKVRQFIEERIEHYKALKPEIDSRCQEMLAEYAASLTDAQDKQEYRLYRAGVEEVRRGYDPIAHKELLPRLRKYEKENIEAFYNPPYRQEFRKLISRYKYIQLVIQGEALGLVVTRMRIDAIKSMVADAPLGQIVNQSEKKTLIFTSYVDVADAIRDKVKAQGFEPLVVYGSTNVNLTGIMKELRTNPKANPLIATYPSLSTAVPVIECNTVVLFDAPFRDHIRNQAVSRVDRLGQDSKVHIVNMLLDTRPADNITTRSLDIMQWSKEMVGAMLGHDADDLPVVSMEGMDDMLYDVDSLDIPEIESIDAIFNYEVADMSRKDVWYNNVFDIPASYYAT